MEQPILQMSGVSKSFQGVPALNSASLNIYRGKVMALLGENGAGKSTLVKIMTGVYPMDDGSLIYKGKKMVFTNPGHSQKVGISVIHQELSLIPELSIAENIFLGREPVKAFGRVNWKAMYDESRKLLYMLDIDISPTTIVGTLGIGLQQMVEIARGISFHADVIVMDEPSDVLTELETESLFRVIKRLKGKDKAIVYISHRLSEISRICDDVTIIRNGRNISETSITELSDDKIAELMVGQKVNRYYPKTSVPKKRNSINLCVKGLIASGVKNVSFNLYKGEILGVSGLIGSGRTALMKALYGANQILSGRIEVGGVGVDIKAPEDALAHGIVYVSKDRKNEGLVADLSVQDNMSLCCLKQFSCFSGAIRSNQEHKAIQQFLHRFKIKLSSVKQPVRNLSGGNQQKVAIVKGLMTDPDILILDEPTRGIDIHSKKEIYQLINDLKSEGVSIILVSSDVSEILGMSDRVLVMYDGRIACEHLAEKTSQEALMRCALGNSCQEKAA